MLEDLRDGLPTSDCAAVLLNLANRQRGFLIVHIFPGPLAVGTSLSIIAVILIGGIAGLLQLDHSIAH